MCGNMKFISSVTPKIVLKHIAESAIIVTCEMTINNFACEIIVLSVAESSIKHYTLYYKIIYFIIYTNYSHRLSDFDN